MVVVYKYRRCCCIYKTSLKLSLCTFFRVCKGANFSLHCNHASVFNLGVIMTINLIKPSLALLAEYVSANEYVRFFEGGLVHTFFGKLKQID